MPSDDVGDYLGQTEPFTAIPLHDVMASVKAYGRMAAQCIKKGAVLGGSTDIDKEYTTKSLEYSNLLGKLTLDELFIVMGKLAIEGKDAGALPPSGNLADLL